MISELRPHQRHGMDLLRHALAAGERRVMFYAPTGYGKTVIAAAIVDGALRKGRRVIFTVPALSLVEQTIERFEAEGITASDVGVMQGDHRFTNSAAPVQIASVQTLLRRKIPKADVVVVDEAHQMFKLFPRWMAEPEWANVPFIGLSATPGSRGLGKLYTHMVRPATLPQLIGEGYLTPFRVFAPSHPDLSHVRVQAGDFHEGDLSEAMNQDHLVADVVQTWKARAEGRSTLCFAVDRAHAAALQRKFLESGVSAAYIDAYTPISERKQIEHKLHAGEYQVVCNVGTLTTGVDWDVRCIILARPTKSEMLYVQIIGRGLRTAPGKQDCIVLDHSDTTLRLGFVTDVAFETLDGHKAKESQGSRPKEPKPRECAKCQFVRPAKVHECPACGFTPEAQSGVKTEDGELVELADTRSLKADRETKQAWYSMLLHIAYARGYKSGWAANQYRQKFGVWPRSLVERPMTPNSEVLKYVRFSAIKYAKRKAA